MKSALKVKGGNKSLMLATVILMDLLAYCISLFFVGGLADSFGRKPIILFGIIIFIIGSISCLWAPSYSFLLVGRFFQGIGIAAPAILSFLIIADSYPLKQQQFWMAMLNGVKNTAVAIAPLIGSYITLYFHWHGNFLRENWREGIANDARSLSAYFKI